MSSLKEKLLQLVKDGVVAQNEIKTNRAVSGSTQREVLKALTELVSDGELSVTNNRVRGNTYAINFRQPLPPLEEGTPAVPPTTDSFPEKEPVFEDEPELPTKEDIAEFNKLADAAETAKAPVVPPVVDVPAPAVNNPVVKPVAKLSTTKK